jgi:decaprenylphospho-beta-D-erythro-pentofuranosid-2-ulose 2-reductase
MKKGFIIGAASALLAIIVAWIAKSRLDQAQSTDLQAAIKSTRKVFIIGATSAIAQETAKLFAATRSEIFLAGRNEAKLQAVANDLSVRGAKKVDFMALDLNDFDRHPALINRATESLGGLDTVLIAHGTLGDQEVAQKSFAFAEGELKTNLLSYISLLTILANQFEAQQYGTIAVISSVAGDRGRQSNYVYGTAKAALSTFTQGLRGRLSRSNVAVVTIKPGFVDTPMTAHLKKGLLFVGPEVVGKGIYQAIQERQDVVYIPWFWWGIMTVIKLIPESIFKRMTI